MVRTGRRSGDAGTRDAILGAAREAFAARGYDGTTIRMIASAATVDPALVHHYFGTKEHLFLTVLGSAVDPPRVLSRLFDGPVESMGERMVAQFLRLWEGGAGANASALLRTAVVSERAARLVREAVFPAVVQEAVGRLGIDPADAALRIALIAAQLSGLVTARYVLRLEPLATAPADVVIAAIGAVVQRFLTEDLPAARQ